jgi:hypothetical protein
MAAVASCNRVVWCAVKFNGDRDCRLFDTQNGALRFLHDIPQTQDCAHIRWPHTQAAYHATLRQLHTRTTTESDPIWIIVTTYDILLHGTLADAVVQLTRKPLPRGVPLETMDDVWELCGDLAWPQRGQHDLPGGALFKPPRADLKHPLHPRADLKHPWRLYRRFVQPDGAAYCAKVVEQVAADNVLPVVGVPELVASFL